MSISTQNFGSIDGQDIHLYELRNQQEHCIQLTNYGAILVRVEVPDRNGKIENVNLGFSSLEKYLAGHPYLGSTVGRFCNRIAAGKFNLDSNSYELAINNGPNHLHGGIVGFDKLIWAAEILEGSQDCGVRFSLESPDGQEGYPGTLQIVAEYRWNDSNELSYSFQATTDKPTVLNLTNHAYWNLGGVGSGDIRGHELKLFCDRYLDVDADLIPTGELVPTDGTSLDFADFRTLGERLDEFEVTKGYDHCYVVNGEAGGEARVAGIARDPQSGRCMEVRTTQPGMQLYTGNHLEGDFEAYSGFCLETQHYPDSPNKPEFPTTRLNPGETFSQQTIHRFFVAD
ncbi:MAG: aldose epimerase family protein [Planctomycetota bacterium]